MAFQFRNKELYIKIILVVFLACETLNCQTVLNSGYQVTHLKSLPQNDINTLMKDSRGFIWIGTLDGLVRFDGYSSKTYRLKQGENSISSNMIIAIDEDYLGNIWIATFGKGLCKLNPEKELFTLYQQENDIDYRIQSNDIISMLVDSNIVWLGNRFGLSRIQLDLEMDAIKNYDLIPTENIETASAKLGGVKMIFKDNKGKIWLGLNSNLALLDNPFISIDSLNITKIKGNISSMGYVGNKLIAGGEYISEVKQVTVDSVILNTLSNESGHLMLTLNQKIWAGNRKGVYIFSLGENGGLKTENHFTTETLNNQLSSNLVSCIISDENNRIWVGTKGGGVNIISPQKKPFYHFKKSKNPKSLSNNLTRVFFEDSKQNLWVGTEEGGLNYLVGKDKYNYSSGFKNMFIENYPKENNRVYSIAEQKTPKSDRYKRLIWLGTSFPTNLIAFSPESFEFVQMPAFIKNIGFVFSIAVQSDSVLWVGTYGNGLWKFNTNNNGQIIKHSHFTPDDDTSFPISSYIIRSLLIDSKNNLWIGTDKGLNRVMPDQLSLSIPIFKVYRQGENSNQITHDYILQLFESVEGKIWMGSMGGGLIGIKQDENKTDSISFLSVTTADGLPNNSIKGIQEDEEGNLWLSSNHGLTKYNPINQSVVNYDIEDGLQDNEFTEIVSCSRVNGQLIFGGNNGFNVFYPKQILKDTIKPKLFFTDLYILNEHVATGKAFNGEVILPQSIEYTESISLKHKYNSFSIRFVGLQFNSPQKNRYKYMLKGFDSKWVESSADHRIAKYTNIPSGEYTFKVLASNCDNVWNVDPISLQIKIKPHPLLSIWAYFSYTCLFAIILIIIIRIARIISNRKKELLIAGVEKQKTEEMAQMKLRFFTNISHEFRTPLTLITVPLENLLKSNKKYTKDQTKNLGIIKQNTNLMLRLVNQLLDFRRLEQNKTQLNLKESDIVSFSRRIFESFSLLAKEKDIYMEFETSNLEIILSFDRDKIEKVIYNLLSNALKFTPNKGNIKLIVEDNSFSNFVKLIVKDNGIGIKESDQSRIFERYFQTKNEDSRHITGTGIGLSFSKGLVELHKGQIRLISKKGVGSTFIVTLPKSLVLSDTNLKDEDKTEIKQENLTIDLEPNNTMVDLLSFKEEKMDYKVLIVEDNMTLRETIANNFAEYFTVYQAEDGMDGYNKCIDVDPNLVISDIMMPNMDGIELLTKIKNEENISHIPVILLTAKDSVEDRVEGHLTGADAYISKPFNTDVLLANSIAVLKNNERLRHTFQKEIEINPMIISNSPADVRFMEKILSLIEENLSDPEFNVEKLSKAYGVSRIYLNRKVKALTGETSNQFLRDIRLKHAAELLKQDSLNISEVTWQVGYTDLETFRNRFKEKFGLSPSDFAKKWRSSN